MSIFLIFALFSLAISNAVGKVETDKLIGHFPSSTGPFELFHITDEPNKLRQFPTFPPGAFTYKPPYQGNTFPPSELVVEKDSYATRSPRRDLYSWAPKVQKLYPTFAPGSFTFNPPYQGNTFRPQRDLISWAPKKLYPTFAPGSFTFNPPYQGNTFRPQSDLISWAPKKLFPTFAPGAFTYKPTYSPPKNTFPPHKVKKEEIAPESLHTGHRFTKSSPPPQRDIYSWAPKNLAVNYPPPPQ